MRYILRQVWIIAGAALCIAACSREEPAGAPGGREAVLRAWIVNEETRTGFDSHVGKFAWSEGDRIAIHLSDGTFHSTEVNPETGAFTCSTTPTKKRDAYAIYPASAADAANYGSPTLNVILPAEYDIADEPSSIFAPVPMIAVNRQAEDDLYFRHVGGLLRITCDRVPVGTKSIAVTASRNIAGTFAVTNPASENPTISTGGNSPTVTFHIAASALTEKASGIILNLPVPVGPLATLKLAALDASGAELYAVTRDIDIDIPRYHGKKVLGSLTEVYSDSMEMILTAGDETDWTYKIPFKAGTTLPADMRILWGDGSVVEYPAGTAVENNTDLFSHTYSAAGDYTLTIEIETETPGQCKMPVMTYDRRNSGSDYQEGDSQKMMLRSLPTPLLPMDATDAACFRRCSRLTHICPDLFIKNPRLSNFDYVFHRCTSLTEIPADLFSHNPDAKSFYFAFGFCTSLSSIPETLFSSNPKITSFGFTFTSCTGLSCTIPERLFAGNPLATDFNATFYGCKNLVGAIPEGLFANNPLAESFSSVFYDCINLTGSIPERLFVNNTKVKSFSGCFRYCDKLTGTIPEDLFANAPLVTDFSLTFNHCLNITGTIPEKLFSRNPKVQSFWSTFDQCWGLEGTIPENLFANNPDVTDFTHTFCWETRLRGPIPENLFANNRKVTTFRGLFELSGIDGSVPENLFANQPDVTNFDYVFRETDISEIPAGLFANNSKVTSFHQAFESALRLRSVPDGLFEHNPLATDFYRCFYYNNLTISSKVFTGTTWTPETRFASCTLKVNFQECFYWAISDNDSSSIPELWNYTYGNGVNSSRCFTQNSYTIPGVPDGWK